MQFRRAISTIVLVALLTWTTSAMCAPLSAMQTPVCDKMAYRTMVMEHPQVKGMASHKCCPPQKVVVIVCYRMHGDGGCDSMSRCYPMHGDEAISGTAKYHDGQARACATAHATKLLVESHETSGAPWERAGLRYERPVFEAKADLRV